MYKNNKTYVDVGRSGPNDDQSAPGNKHKQICYALLPVFRYSPEGDLLRTHTK